MPQIFVTITLATVALLGIGGLVIGGLKMTAPVPAAHAAIVEACTPATEISAVTSYDSALSAKLIASPGAGTGTLNAQPVIGRVVGQNYVVTVGAGTNAKTCAMSLAKRSL